MGALCPKKIDNQNKVVPANNKNHHTSIKQATIDDHSKNDDSILKPLDEENEIYKLSMSKKQQAPPSRTLQLSNKKTDYEHGGVAYSKGSKTTPYTNDSGLSKTEHEKKRKDAMEKGESVEHIISDSQGNSSVMLNYDNRPMANNRNQNNQQGKNLQLNFRGKSHHVDVPEYESSDENGSEDDDDDEDDEDDSDDSDDKDDIDFKEYNDSHVNNGTNPSNMITQPKKPFHSPPKRMVTKTVIKGKKRLDFCLADVTSGTLTTTEVTNEGNYCRQLKKNQPKNNIINKKNRYARKGRREARENESPAEKHNRQKEKSFHNKLHDNIIVVRKIFKAIISLVNIVNHMDKSLRYDQKREILYTVYQKLKERDLMELQEGDFQPDEFKTDINGKNVLKTNDKTIMELIKKETIVMKTRQNPDLIKGFDDTIDDLVDQNNSELGGDFIPLPNIVPRKTNHQKNSGIFQSTNRQSIVYANIVSNSMNSFHNLANDDIHNNGHDRDNADGKFFGAHQRNYKGHTDSDEVITRVDYDRYMFFSTKQGRIAQYDYKEKQVYKEFKNFQDNPSIIKVTPNNKYLFIGNEIGHLQQYCLSSGNLIRGFGKVSQHCITGFVVSSDSRFQIFGDSEGNIKEWHIANQCLSHDWGSCVKGHINPMFLTPNNEKLIVACKPTREVVQFSIKTKLIEKNYGSIHKGTITALSISADSAILFTGDSLGHVKIISIVGKFVMKDINAIFSDIDNNKKAEKVSEPMNDWDFEMKDSQFKDDDNYDGLKIESMVYCSSGNFLFIAGEKGFIFQFAFVNGDLTMVKKYGTKSKCCILKIKLSSDEKYLWTGDAQGFIRQLGVVEKTCIQDYGNIGGDRIKHIELFKI